MPRGIPGSGPYAGKNKKSTKSTKRTVKSTKGGAPRKTIAKKATKRATKKG